MRKIERDIIGAVKYRSYFAQRGQNAVTGKRGLMYEVEHLTGGITRVWYWGTAVATIHFHAGLITFHTGGYRGKTTKQTINAVLEALGQPWRVYQKNYTWYIYRGEDMEPLEFKEGKPYSIGSVLSEAS